MTRFFFGGHTYEFVTTARTWQDASTYAQAQGGHLAVITSASENSAIIQAALADTSHDHVGCRRRGEVRKITVTATRVSDLKGLPVAVVGSARAMGRVLDRRHALNLQFVPKTRYAQTPLQAGDLRVFFAGRGSLTFALESWTEKGVRAR